MSVIEKADVEDELEDELEDAVGYDGLWVYGVEEDGIVEDNSLK